MPEFSTVIVVPLSFVISLFALAWLSQQISVHIQIPVYYGTRSKDALAVALFLVFLPGVFIHEAAHWTMAKICGLKTAKFRVWPKRQGDQIGLGSVNVESGGAFFDALVGMAPLIAGTLLIGLISHFVFGTDRLAEAATAGDWRGRIAGVSGCCTGAGCAAVGVSPVYHRQRHDAERQRSGTAQAGCALQHRRRRALLAPRPAARTHRSSLRLGAAHAARTDQRLRVHDPARRRCVGRPLRSCAS